MFLVDTAEQRIVSDEELKHRVATEHPYQEWVREWLVKLTELPPRRASSSRTTKLCCAARRSSATPPRTSES